MNSVSNTNASLVSEQDSIRICNLSGIGLAGEQLVKYEKLSRGIDIALRDLDAQQSEEEVINKSLMVLRLTKATCDGFIDLAAELTKSAVVVKSIYGATSELAGAVATEVTGGEADWGKSGSSALKSLTGLIKNEAAQYFIKNAVVKTELVVGAMNGNRDQLKKSSIEYMTDLHQYALDAIEKHKASAFLGIAKASFDYHENINNAFDAYLADQEEAQLRNQNMKVTLIHQGRKIRQKIAELNNFLRSCEIRKH